MNISVLTLTKYKVLIQTLLYILPLKSIIKRKKSHKLANIFAFIVKFFFQVNAFFKRKSFGGKELNIRFTPEFKYQQVNECFFFSVC